MSARPLLLPFFAACGLLACGPAALPPEPPPAPGAPPVVVESGPEANLVRCGVDDQPRTVGGRPSRSRAGRELLGIAFEAPMVPPGALAQSPPVPSLPPLVVSIEPGPPRVGTAPAPRSVGLVGAASVDVCESLAAVSDSGPLELEVELASTAVPLRVRSSRPAPGPFVRCLMERACRVKTGPAAASQRLTLPLAIKVEAPPPLPPPPPSAPTSQLVARLIKGREEPADRQGITNAVNALGQVCLGSTPPLTGTFRLRLELRDRDLLKKNSFLGAPLLGPRAPRVEQPQAMWQITEVKAESLLTTDQNSLVTCMRAFLTQQPLVQQGRPRRQVTVRFDVEITHP